MKALAVVIETTAGILAVLPGIAALATGIGVPEGHQTLFGAVLTIGGVLVLLFAFIARRSIAEWRPSTVIVTTVATLAVSSLMFVGYRQALGYTAISYEDILAIPPDTVSLLFPLTARGDLATMIERAGGRVAAIDMYGRRAVEDELHKPYLALAQAQTLTVLVGSYVLALALAILGLAMAGWSAVAHGDP